MRFKVAPKHIPGKYYLWFAWYPVRLENKDEVVWLDYVWKNWDWDYDGCKNSKYYDKVPKGE